MYDIEKYDQAVDVADAIRALENDPDAVVISGGSDVLIKIREGKLAGCSLVSIHGIKELEGVSLEPDGTIAKHQVMRLCCTFDHRAMDGAVEARFGMDLRDLLQSPVEILL